MFYRDIIDATRIIFAESRNIVAPPASHPQAESKARSSSHTTPTNTKQQERKQNMKLKVNWKELVRQLWAAIRPVLLGAIGGGIVSFASGCSSLTPSD